MSKKLEVYLSVGSPFAYFSITQLEMMVERTGCEVEYNLLDLGVIKELADNPGPAVVPGKLNYLIKDIKDWVEFLGIPFNMPAKFPVTSRESAAVGRLAREKGKLNEFVEALMPAYWVDGKDPSNPEVLATIGAGVGLDAAEVKAAISDADNLAALHKEMEAAVKRGVFGVPTFFVGDDMYWGNDRLMFVANALMDE